MTSTTSEIEPVQVSAKSEHVGSDVSRKAPDTSEVVARLTTRLADYDADLQAAIAARILPDREAYGEDVSGVTYAEVTAALTLITTLLEANAELTAERDALAKVIDPDDNRPALMARIIMASVSRQGRIYELEELVERAFRDGLAYGGNVENADPDVAWQHSKARSLLSTGGGNGR
jgi:hypothetical protein